MLKIFISSNDSSNLRHISKPIAMTCWCYFRVTFGTLYAILSGIWNMRRIFKCIYGPYFFFFFWWVSWDLQTSRRHSAATHAVAIQHLHKYTAHEHILSLRHSALFEWLTAFLDTWPISRRVSIHNCVDVVSWKLDVCRLSWDVQSDFEQLLFLIIFWRRCQLHNSSLSNIQHIQVFDDQRSWRNRVSAVIDIHQVFLPKEVFFSTLYKGC